MFILKLLGKKEKRRDERRSLPGTSGLEFFRLKPKLVLRLSPDILGVGSSEPPGSAFFMLTGIFSTLLIPETKQRSLEELSNEKQDGFIRGPAAPAQSAHVV